MSRRASPPPSQRAPYSPEQPTFNRTNSNASNRQNSSSSRFEYDDGDPRSQRAPPSRPERSMRRPINTTSPPPAHEARFPDQDDSRAFRRAGVQEGRLNVSETMIRSTSGSSAGTDEGNYRNVNATGTGSSGDKSRRMMERLNFNSGSSSAASTAHLQPSTAFSSNGGQRRRDSADSSSSVASSAIISPGASPLIPSPRKPSIALSSTRVGENGQNVEMRRDRRGAAGEQGIASVAVRKKVTLNAQDYPDTPAFREIESVLRTIKSDWPILLQGTSEEVAQEADKEYDPVALALALLSPSTVGTAASLPAFMRLKLDLDHAISSSLASSSSSYRAYESSITTYNSTLASLAASVKVVGSLKQGLGAAREKLEGKGKEGLAAMYNRMNHLEEMLKILDEM